MATGVPGTSRYLSALGGLGLVGLLGGRLAAAEHQPATTRWAGGST
jgi:hypothetical protein